MKGFQSPVINIDAAESLSKQKIDHCKSLRGSEQVFAVQRLIAENPEYALDPWVGEQDYKFKTSESTQ